MKKLFLLGSFLLIFSGYSEQTIKQRNNSLECQKYLAIADICMRSFFVIHADDLGLNKQTLSSSLAMTLVKYENLIKDTLNNPKNCNKYLNHNIMNIKHLPVIKKSFIKEKDKACFSQKK